MAPPNRILFVRAGTLLAASIDVSKGALSSEPLPVAQQVGTDAQTTRAALTVAADSLAYRRSGNVPRQLTWVDRTGTTTGTIGEFDEAGLFFVQLSPDGERVAVQRTVDGNADLWLTSSVNPGFTRVTFAPNTESAPVWSRDGLRLAYRSSQGGVFNLFDRPAAGPGEERTLVSSAQSKTPNDWSPDGRVLLYEETQQGSTDIWGWSASGERPVLVQRGASRGQFSPDGRWFAYQAATSGRAEAYIQAFPPVGSPVIASTAGGSQPRWSADGSELFYVAPDGWMMAAHIVRRGAGLQVRTPVRLFEARLYSAGGPNQQYAVSRDGRFLLNRRVDAAVPLTFVMNWSRLLTKLQ